MTDSTFKYFLPGGTTCESMTCAMSTQNVGDTERVISVIGGGAIAMYGLSRGSLSGLAIAAIGGAIMYRGITGNCEMYKALGISTAREEDSFTGVPAQQGFKYERTLTVNRPPQDLYDQWRRFENLPRIMRHLVSVTDLGGGRSHWVAEGPMKSHFEWDAELHNEEPGRLIAWRSLPGSQVDTAGSVHFDELGAGTATLLRVSLKYNPPGGKVAAGAAWLMGAGVEREIDEDLHRFKQSMESSAVTSISSQRQTPVM